jgi:chromate transporter
MHGVRGGLVAGVLFILPGFVSILGLSIVYGLYQQTTVLAALFFGLKAAVLAIVFEAVLRIGRRILHHGALVALAAAAFAAMFFFAVPFPLVIAGAAVTGLLAGRRWPQVFTRPTRTASGGGALLPDDALPRERPDRARSWRTLGVGLALWGLPILLLALLFGTTSIFVEEAWFFSGAAVVTFGGAYAVLAYVAQRAVESGWLSAGAMVDGLGMAESTPGPLIQVVQFVAFMGAYANPGPLEPLAAGLLASVVVTWVTFVPSFLWIFLGAPYIEHLRGRRWLDHAMSGITAAVVGVILNLALWFGLHVLFGELGETTRGPMHILVPAWDTLDGLALALVVGAAAGLAMRVPMVAVIAVMAALGAGLAAL